MNLRILFSIILAFVINVQAAIEKSDANSGVNNPTASDQGNSIGDVEITRQIRRSLMQNPSLSVNSKNIQIITLHGQVTLKGQVASVREQKEIVRAAQAVAGVQGLFNQTEVAKAKE